jgi:hypothetical protein
MYGLWYKFNRISNKSEWNVSRISVLFICCVPVCPLVKSSCLSAFDNHLSVLSLETVYVEPYGMCQGE